MKGINMYKFILFIVNYVLMYKFVLFVVNHMFTDARGYSEGDRKQMAIAVIIAPFTTVSITILVMSVILWDNFDRAMKSPIKNNRFFVVNRNKTTEYFVRKEVDSNGLLTRSTGYYRNSGMNMHTTEIRSQFKAIDGQIVWKIQRIVYDTADRPIYRNNYIEGTPTTQISGYRMEYDKNSRLIKKEQLLGLVIELDANSRSYVKNIGTVISSSSIP
jgi:hypothetical protein